MLKKYDVDTPQAVVDIEKSKKGSGLEISHFPSKSKKGSGLAMTYFSAIIACC